MARRKKAAPRLSRRAATRNRLDAIGEWSAEAGEGVLTIVWESPPDLATRGLALGLQFQVESEGEDFDPDDRMFELWESIRGRRVAVLRDLKARMATPVVGPDGEDLAERPDLDPYDPVVIIRRSDSRGEPRYDVEVVAEAGDEEHILSLRYDPETGTFGPGWELM